MKNNFPKNAFQKNGFQKNEFHKNEFFTLIQTRYNYSDFEIAKLKYTLTAIASEFSKLILMGLLFLILGHFFEYLVAVSALLLIRGYSGGLHFNHYVACFAFTLGIFLLSVLLLPRIFLPFVIEVLLLLFCILITYIVGPITSNNRPVLSLSKYTKFRIRGCKFMLLLSVLFILFPYTTYSKVVFWIIVLQTIQLIIARCAKKGDLYETKHA